MFEIQEDHVRKILIVALTLNGINASMTNVSKFVKTIVKTMETADMKIIV